MIRFVKYSLFTLSALLLLILLLATGLWWLLDGSLARLDGTLSNQQVTHETRIERDAQGLVTLRGDTRNDIAYALGFVHAQERLFQMDLLRRNSAGELSVLFGERAADFDARIRTHQFRKRSEVALANLPVEHQALLQAYADGVNAGIADLRSAPFEYLLLQTDIKPWTPADTMLVVYSMYMDLQDEWGETERSLTAMVDLLPADWVAFLTPTGGEWDATIDGGDLSLALTLPEQPLSTFQSADQSSAYRYRDQIEIGSNNWSVSGNLTPHGAALVADDMHLGLDVPNIWFRASWLLPDSGQRITGATLPGAPIMVIGSNQYVAWGFTNAYGDFMDLIRLQTNAEETEYLTPNGWKAFETEREIIGIKDSPDQTIQVRRTQWGPVIGEDHYGNLLAMRWVAHDRDSVNLGLLKLESARTVEDALAIAAKTSVPGQNFNVGDHQGNIGWTIMGALPQRQGFSTALQERLTQDWSDGRFSWQGRLPADQYPRYINPENDRIWTANARIVSGEAYRKVGDGLGAIGARQQQIRDRLMEKTSFNPSDFLSIHLDDEARFLARWQSRLTDVLSTDALADPIFDDYREQVTNWQRRAAASSVGYRLVKEYRERVIDETVGQVLDYVDTKTADFWPGYVDNRLEYATWTLITEQPEQHLPAGYRSWDALLAGIAIDVFQSLNDPESGLTDATWGAANTLDIRHPMSSALPMLGSFLDMPAVPMSGDTFMPRVQGTDFGASQRMAVAPGYESEGYFHMATGQSGHPLSPFYGAGHEDWVQGVASPFLPGATEYELILTP